MEPTDGYYLGFRTDDGLDHLILGPSLDKSLAARLHQHGVVASIYPEVPRERWLLYQSVAPQLVDWAQGDDNRRFRFGPFDRERTPTDTLEWWRPSDTPNSIRWVGLANGIVLTRGEFSFPQAHQPGLRTLAHAVASVDPVATLSITRVRPAELVRGEREFGKAVFTERAPAVIDPGMTVRFSVGDISPITTTLASVSRADTQNGGDNYNPLITLVRFVNSETVHALRSYVEIPVLDYSAQRSLTDAELKWLETAPVSNDLSQLDPFRPLLSPGTGLTDQAATSSIVRTTPKPESGAKPRTVRPVILPEEAERPSASQPAQPSLLDLFYDEIENPSAPSPKPSTRSQSKAAPRAESCVRPIQDQIDFS